jgi:hypothetical protein
MAPVGALLAAFHQVPFFVNNVRGIGQDPLFQLSATVFDFAKFLAFSLHADLDARRGEDASAWSVRFQAYLISRHKHAFSQAGIHGAGGREMSELGGC